MITVQDIIDNAMPVCPRCVGQAHCTCDNVIDTDNLDLTTRSASELITIIRSDVPKYYREKAAIALYRIGIREGGAAVNEAWRTA